MKLQTSIFSFTSLVLAKPACTQTLCNVCVVENTSEKIQRKDPKVVFRTSATSLHSDFAVCSSQSTCTLGSSVVVAGVLVYHGWVDIATLGCT